MPAFPFKAQTQGSERCVFAFYPSLFFSFTLYIIPHKLKNPLWHYARRDVIYNIPRFHPDSMENFPLQLVITIT